MISSLIAKSGLSQFPIWPYLNQPLFHGHYQVVFNPQRFRYLYTIALLERCLEQESPLKDHHYD